MCMGTYSVITRDAIIESSATRTSTDDDALSKCGSKRPDVCSSANAERSCSRGGMKTHLLHSSEALAAALLLGCGSAPSAFVDGRAPQTSPGPAGDSGASIDNPDATVPGGDTDAGVFLPSSTGEPGTIVTLGACAPGVYRGKFMTNVGAGAHGGNAANPLSIKWNGDITIDLSAQKITMTSTSGGELPTTTSTSTLAITDGGALDGSDVYGGSFFASLNGELNCAPDAGPPYRLSATLGGGSYRLSFSKIPIVGNLTADYQARDAGTPPMLVNGAILVGGVFLDGGTPTASAGGTWSATWVSP